MKLLILILLLFAVVSADTSSQHEVPTLLCYLIERAPVIDGVLDDVCWKQGEVASNFTLLRYGGAAVEQTQAMVTYDGRNLYIGFICLESKKEGMRMQCVERDGPVWLDDCVEVFLDTRHDHKTYFHLITNLRGTKYDEKGYLAPNSWTAQWEVATATFDGGWSVEIALPFKSMGLTMPKAGTIWGLNLNREQWKIPEWNGWAGTVSHFHEPVNFGHLFFLPSF